MDNRRSIAASDFHTKVWSLLLLRALNKAGLSPCDNGTFHRVAYFANVLASVYDFQPPSEVVMRHRRGPFYPRIQEDLDWLCLVGYGSVTNISYEKKEDLWVRSGTYDITESGFALAQNSIAEISWASDAAVLLDDLSVAMSLTDDGFSESAEEKDFTYTRSSSEVAPVFNFRDSRNNLTLQATEQLGQDIVVGASPIPQRMLRLYLKYLNRAAA